MEARLGWDGNAEWEGGRLTLEPIAANIATANEFDLDSLRDRKGAFAT